MPEYISREAALQAMWNALYALEDRQEAESGLDIMRRADVQAGFEAGQQVVAEFPAADVVEVRHERWDLAKDPFGAGYVKCSRCGYKHCPEYYPDGSAIMHLFCPSCGAKMDGGQDDGI